MVLLRSLSVFSSLLLASCWVPVYNQDLSVAELVRSKLTLEREGTPVLNNGTQDGYEFQAVQSHDGATLLVAASSHNTVTETSYLGSPLVVGTSDSQPLDVPLSDPRQAILQPAGVYAACFVPTVPNGSGLASGSSSGNGAIVRFQGGFTDTLNFPDSASNTKTDLIGFSTDINSGLLEVFYLTVDVNGASLYQETGSLNGTPPPAVLSNIPYLGKSGWMAVDMSGAAGTGGPVIYLTHAPDSKGQFVTEMIDSGGLLGSWKGRDYVVAFLSTGRLLTREGAFYNVCDAKGNILYSFPAGSLQFAGEYPSGATMRSRFTECLAITPQNKGEDQLRIRVYSIETFKLDTLAH